MLIERVKNGDRVEITAVGPNGDEATFKTKVETVLDKNRVIIQAPIEKGRNIKLPKEMKYSVLFISDLGMFRFGALVTDYMTVDGFNMVTLKLTTEGERVQRRDFFRFNCNIPVEFIMLNEEGEQEGTATQEGVIRDIGGGGMRMQSAFSMEEASRIRATLQLEDESILAYGQVLHKQYSPGTKPPFQYRVKFTAMSNTEQEKIIRFIYNEQRRSLQRQR